MSADTAPQTAVPFSYERGTATRLLNAITAADVTGAGGNLASDGVAVVAASSGKGYLGPRAFVFQTIVGQPNTNDTLTAVTVIFEGSLDGQHWVTLGQSTQVAGEMVWVVENPTLQIRCRVTTMTEGVGHATLTVLFAAL